MPSNGPLGASPDVQQELLALSDFPVELSNTRESQLLHTAVAKLLKVLPEVCYVRVQVGPVGPAPAAVLEVCPDPSLTQLMEQQLATGNTALAAAARTEATVLSPGLSSGCGGWADLEVLGREGGLGSAAAVPLLMGGAAKGAVLVASRLPGYICSRTQVVLEVWAAMLAPYAGLAVQAGALASLRPILGSMLPPRVAAQVLATAADARPFVDLPLQPAEHHPP